MVILLIQQWKMAKNVQGSRKLYAWQPRGMGDENNLCNMGVPSCEAVVLDVYGGDTGRIERERQRGLRKMNIHKCRSNHICTCIIHMCLYRTWLRTNADIYTNTKMFPEHFKFYFDFLLSCYTFFFIYLFDWLFIYLLVSLRQGFTLSAALDLTLTWNSRICLSLECWD